MDDGSVHSAKIFLAASEDDKIESCEIDVRFALELRPPRRLPVTRLSWMRRKDELMLVLATQGGVDLNIYSTQFGNTYSPSISRSCRHKNFSPVVGNSSLFLADTGTVMSGNNDDLDITLIHQLLPTTTIRYSSDGHLNPLPESIALKTAFDAKLEAYNSPGTNSVFKIAGGNASYNSTFLGIYYEYKGTGYG